jgi:hypothetical protein
MDRVTQEKLARERAQRELVEKEDQDFRHRMIKRQEAERAEEQKNQPANAKQERSKPAEKQEKRQDDPLAAKRQEDMQRDASRQHEQKQRDDQKVSSYDRKWCTGRLHLT